MFCCSSVQPVMHPRHYSYDRLTSDLFNLFNRYAMINNGVMAQGDILIIIRHINNLPVPVGRNDMPANMPMRKVNVTYRDPGIPTQVTVIIKITDVQAEAGLPHHIGRHRSPGCKTSARTPEYPGRRPSLSRHPNPAVPVIPGPASIMKRRPTPGLILNPQPAVLIGIGPVAVSVGSPVLRNIKRIPYWSVNWVIHPVTIGRQGLLKNADADADAGISLYLRRCKKTCAQKYGQECERP